MRSLVRILMDESGTTAVEYCLMLTFIVVALIGAVSSFGGGENGAWTKIWGTMQDHGM